MEQRYLHFQVDSYKNDPHIEAVITGSGKPVSDSQGRLKARFHFLDTVWNSLIKTAFFIAEGEKAYSMLIEENECDIPAEVLQGDGFSLSVYGVEAGQSNYLWTDVCHVGLAQSGSTVAQLPSEPTVDIYTQILAAVEAAQNAAEQAESVSQTAAEQAEEALQAASGVLEAMEPITLPSPPTDATEGTVGQMCFYKEEGAAQASVYVLRSIDKVFDHYNGLTPVYVTKYLWENISGTAIFTDTADAPDDFTPAKAGQLVVTTRAVYICVYALAASQGSYQTKWQLICLLNLQLDAEPTSGLMGFPGQQATYDGNTYICLGGNETDGYEWLRATSEGFVSIVTDLTTTNLNGLLMGQNNSLREAVPNEDYLAPDALEEIIEEVNDIKETMAGLTSEGLDGKQDRITVSGLLKGDGESVVAAVPWNPMALTGSFDYLTPENVGAALGVAGLNGSGRIMPEQHMRNTLKIDYEPWDLTNLDNGLFLRSPSDDDTTIILPAGLLEGMEVVVMRSGEGAVNFVAADGVTLRCASDNPCIAHPYGVVYLKCLVSRTNRATWVVYGDIAPYVTDLTNAQEVAM